MFGVDFKKFSRQDTQGILTFVRAHQPYTNPECLGTLTREARQGYYIDPCSLERRDRAHRRSHLGVDAAIARIM